VVDVHRASAVVLLAAVVGCSIRIDPGPRPTGGSTVVQPPPTPAPIGGSVDDRSCGGLAYPSASCDDCFRSHCCIDGITCASDPSCVALRDCWSGCNDDACGEQCAQDYADGQDDSDRLDGCMQSSCASECE